MSFVEKYFIINILFLIKLPTSNLASIDNSWLNPLVQWQPNGDLLISLFLLRLLKFCSELELSFLPCYLYIPCVSMDLWLPVWCFFFFWCGFLFYAVYIRFSQWEPLQAGCRILLTCLHRSLNISLLYGTRCCILILSFLKS